MNFSSFLGVLMGVGVLIAGLHATTPNLEFFLDPHAILIVCGGTLSAASISYPITQVFSLFRVFLLKFLGKRRIDYQGTISQILELNKKAGMGISALNDSLAGIKHEFLREATALVAAGVLSDREIRSTLEQRLKTTEHRYMHESNMFRSIGRFPPAFGLLATTLGMIGVLQKIGQPDSQKLIGPAMSIGLVGTLYGIALANLIFLPIAESLSELTQEEMILRRLIVEGAVLMKAQANPIAMRETLNSFLLPRERVVRKAAA